MVKKIISAFVDENIVAALRHKAAQEKRTLSKVIELLLEKGLKEVDTNGNKTT